MKFNENILSLKQSDIRRMSIECNKHPEGINLSQGICDLDLPDELINGLNSAVRSGYNIYTRYDGIDELRKNIANKNRKFNNIEYDSSTEILVTSGSTGALFLALFGLMKSGDEIILFQPFYGYHYNTMLSLGIKPITVNMDPEKNWSIDYNELESKINSKTKAVIINTPANPSGKVFSETEIRRIGKICEKYDLLIITDEIYEYITFDGIKHISPASIDGLKKRTITISGFSKTFSITGWRLGYLCANAEIISKLGILNDLFYICAPAPLQKAVSDCMENISESFYKKLPEFYSENRDIIVETLDKIGFRSYVPSGAYYM
ncbi:pyridoxal phosphate-dependent aminotransferase, partial [Candidatus Dependentiae bacterium]|nr:pyridoxal phosphate-dependent aminotransferase [Candidatus Dependentiae bacterium]